MSTGAGPFTWYQSVPGSSPRQRGGSYYSGPSRSQIAAASKQEQAGLITASLEAIAAIHRESFPTAVKPLPDTPSLPSYAELLAGYERQELGGIRWFERTARRAAKTRAREQADAYARHLMAQAKTDRASAAERIDEAWGRLLANEPDEVLAALAAAFEDNEAPVAPVGVEGGEANLVVLVPSADVIPERQPAVTAAGNLSLRKMTKSAAANWHKELVAGHILVSVKEALAVAPGLVAARVVALQDDGLDVYGERALTPVIAVRLTRRSLTGVQWERASAWDILTQADDGTSVVNPARSTGALRPLDLDEQPDIAQLVAAVSFAQE